jgi:hypothetical protein
MRTFVRIALFATIFATPLCIKAQTVPSREVVVPPGGDHDLLIPLSEREYIHLIFNLNELDENGKVINTRHFDAITYAHPQGHEGGGEIRAEDSVPVFDKEGHLARNFTLRSNIFFSSLYVIDQNHISLTVKTDISSLLPTANDEFPINRTNNWTGMILMPIGERRVIFSSDDLASKHTLQLELLVTRVK